MSKGEETEHAIEEWLNDEVFELWKECVARKGANNMEKADKIIESLSEQDVRDFLAEKFCKKRSK